MSGAGQLLGNVVVNNKVVVELSVVVAVAGDISDVEESYSIISSSSASSEITSCKGSEIKQYKIR